MARCLLPIPLSPRHSCVCLYEDLSNSPSTPLPPPTHPTEPSRRLSPAAPPSILATLPRHPPPVPPYTPRMLRTSCNDHIRASGG